MMRQLFQFADTGVMSVVLVSEDINILNQTECSEGGKKLGSEELSTWIFVSPKTTHESW